MITNDPSLAIKMAKQYRNEQIRTADESRLARRTARRAHHPGQWWHGRSSGSEPRIGGAWARMMKPFPTPSTEQQPQSM